MKERRNQEFNLKEFYRITDKGKKYIEKLDELEKRIEYMKQK